MAWLFLFDWWRGGLSSRTGMMAMERCASRCGNDMGTWMG